MMGQADWNRSVFSSPFELWEAMAVGWINNAAETSRVMTSVAASSMAMVMPAGDLIAQAAIAPLTDEPVDELVDDSDPGSPDEEVLVTHILE